MKRSEFTYGQLDKVLRSFGFTCRLVEGEPPARRYEHRETGALVSVPPFPMTERLLAYHLATTRTIVDLFGIAEPEVFDVKLQKAKARAPAPAKDAS